jgi:ribosome-binding protein aMBF1 (putative translation factor)
MLYKSFELGKIINKAGEKKKLSQSRLTSLVKKKRANISKKKNSGAGINLKTLYKILEVGLVGKFKIDL